MPRKKASEKEKKSKSKKSKIPQDEDEISGDSIELDDVDIEDIEDDGNDDMGNSKGKPSYKVIDPETPIGELSIDEILSYLINLGKESLNPGLKMGALNLLRNLKGNKKPNNNYRGNYYRDRGNFNDRPRGDYYYRGGSSRNVYRGD